MCNVTQPPLYVDTSVLYTLGAHGRPPLLVQTLLLKDQSGIPEHQIVFQTRF